MRAVVITLETQKCRKKAFCFVKFKFLTNRHRQKRFLQNERGRADRQNVQSNFSVLSQDLVHGKQPVISGWVRACSHCVLPKLILFFTWRRFDHEKFASTKKTASVCFRFWAWAVWNYEELTFSYFCLSGAFQGALLLYRAVYVDNPTFEKASSQLYLISFCGEKSTFFNSCLTTFTFAWILSPHPPTHPPSET